MLQYTFGSDRSLQYIKPKPSTVNRIYGISRQSTGKITTGYQHVALPSLHDHPAAEKVHGEGAEAGGIGGDQLREVVGPVEGADAADVLAAVVEAAEEADVVSPVDEEVSGEGVGRRGEEKGGGEKEWGGGEWRHRGGGSRA